MPAYNAAAYIGDAIDSVLCQSFSDFELIVVDDGSTDETAAIVDEYSRRDARVIRISQANRGISAARNAGLAASRGRFLALLDSDDAWEPAFLETQLPVFDQMSDIGVVTGNALHCGGSHDGEAMWSTAQGPRVLSLGDLLQNETSVCIMSVFRREVFERIGGFDVQLRCNEDYQYWLRAAMAGYSIVQTPRPLARYRRRPDSVSADQAIMLDGIMRVLREVRGQCDGRPDVIAIIDRQLPRFERERWLLEGKLALLSGQFDGAGKAFAAARHLGDNVKLRAVSLLCRVWPRALQTIYRQRTVTHVAGRMSRRGS
jgi:glycosyltransferase involved in cell wall biosynthesis